MTTTSRESLEQLAKAIEWSEVISEYMLKLEDGLNDEQKLEAIVNSLFEDAKGLRARYFPDYADKPTETVIEYARQQNWLLEQKVQIGAIYGLEDMWADIDIALDAIAWNSERVNATPQEAVKYALGITSSAREADLHGLTPKERRQISVACNLIEIAPQQAAIWSLDVFSYEHERNYTKLIGIAKQLVRTKMYGHESLQARLRDYSEETSQLKAYLAMLNDAAKLWEQDPTGKLFVTKAAEEVKNEPLGRKAELHLPFATGKAAGAAKARDLYIERYELLH